MYTPYDKGFKDSPLFIVDWCKDEEIDNYHSRDITLGRGNMAFWKLRATPSLGVETIDQKDGEMTVRFFLRNYNSSEQSVIKDE